MDLSQKVLSDVIIHMKYARYLPDKGRRETWEELVQRNMNMHLVKFPALEKDILEAYQFVFDRKVLPSMRTMQFAGRPIELNASRGFNCSYLPMDDTDAFSETMFLLLGGTGVGYSVQQHHIDKLPRLRGPIRAEEDGGKNKRYLISDNLEGWADTIKMLMESYFFGKKDIDFDYRDIRQKGAQLVTAGGKAPGPQPLKDCVHNIRKVLDNALQERGKNCRLTSLEVHDILCYIADAVLSGGIRRSAMISFFSYGDDDMLNCKNGPYWETNSQRGRANNTVVLLRHKLTKESFDKLWNRIQQNGTGEPGIFLTNDKNMLGNPCQPSWAKVLTPEGVRTFADIDVGSKIWSKEGWTTVTKKWATGAKPVYKYQTTAGVFYGTEKHRVVSGGTKVEVGVAETIEQLTGPTTFPKDWVLSPQDIMDGLVLGDGTVHKASNNLVLLCIGQKDTDYFSSEIAPLITKARPGIGPTVHEIKTTLTAKELPKTYERKIPSRYMESFEKMRGFLRGMYSANGSIAGNRVTLKSTSKFVIDDVQTMLSALGIRSYYTTNHSRPNTFVNGVYQMRESYDLNVTHDKKRFMDLIGFIQKYKVPVITEAIKPCKLDYDITGVSLVGEEEVFDITVDNESHTYWTQGCNVSNCLEASLHAHTFCNLVTILVADITTQAEFELRCRVAAFISTLQADYTDFHYLREDWRKNTERDALLGVSMTGIATQEFLDNVDLVAGAEIVLEENERVTKLLKINKAARTTLVKPDGTSSLLLGCSSGIHAWYDHYYIRRIRVGKNEPIYTYFLVNNPELLEEDEIAKDTAIIVLPIKAPDGAITRNESAEDTLERVKKVYNEWIVPGHRKGSNTHNSSVTINIKPGEWESVRDWMWEHRNDYNGISVLPYDNGVYIQAPFETITKKRYDELMKKVHDIDLSMVWESQDGTNLSGEIACGGGACEIR